MLSYEADHIHGGFRAMVPNSLFCAMPLPAFISPHGFHVVFLFIASVWVILMVTYLPPVALTVLNWSTCHQSADGAREGGLPRHVWRLWTWATFTFVVTHLGFHCPLHKFMECICAHSFPPWTNSPVLYARGHMCICLTCCIHGIDKFISYLAIDVRSLGTCLVFTHRHWAFLTIREIEVHSRWWTFWQPFRHGMVALKKSCRYFEEKWNK